MQNTSFIEQTDLVIYIVCCSIVKYPFHRVSLASNQQKRVKLQLVPYEFQFQITTIRTDNNLFIFTVLVYTA